MDEQEEKHKGSLCSGSWRKEALAGDPLRRAFTAKSGSRRYC